MNYVTPAPQRPSLLEWLTFLFGGFLGAVVVLGLERWLNHRQSSKERIQITKAMEEEVDSNLQNCKEIIASITSDNKKIYALIPISTIWMDKYRERCIDFTDDDSIRLYTFMRGAKSFSEQMGRFEAGLSMFSSTSRALMSYQDGVVGYNSSILERTNQLLSTLSAIKERRVDNKIYKETVLEHQDKS